MMRTIVTAVLLMSQSGAGTPDALLVRLVGRWTGEGTVLKQPARVQLTWAWTLDGQFLQLTFVNQLGSRRFEGRAYYRPLGPGRYRGMWFDNSGAIRPIDAVQDGDALVSTWGTPDTEVGETTYRLMDDGSMAIVDRVRGRDGKWRDFGRTRVTLTP